MKAKLSVTNAVRVRWGVHKDGCARSRMPTSEGRLLSYDVIQRASLFLYSSLLVGAIGWLVSAVMSSSDSWPSSNRR